MPTCSLGALLKDWEPWFGPGRSEDAVARCLGPDSRGNKPWFGSDWEATALDVLREESVEVDDRLWVVQKMHIPFNILDAWARWCALQVIDTWEAPEVVRRFLETGDETLRKAARSAAAGVATSYATYAATYAADGSTFSAASWAAISAAARRAQLEKLVELITASPAAL
jgi:hypothetical protein